MAETSAALPRHEINHLAFDDYSNGEPVKTLVYSGVQMLKTEFWLDASICAELLTELENAVAILEKRCDYLSERELSS